MYCTFRRRKNKRGKLPCCTSPHSAPKLSVPPSANTGHITPTTLHLVTLHLSPPTASTGHITLSALRHTLHSGTLSLHLHTRVISHYLGPRHTLHFSPLYLSPTFLHQQPRVISYYLGPRHTLHLSPLFLSHSIPSSTNMGHLTLIHCEHETQTNKLPVIHHTPHPSSLSLPPNKHGL